jgi:hypothetical protein
MAPSGFAEYLLMEGYGLEGMRPRPTAFPLLRITSKPALRVAFSKYIFFTITIVVELFVVQLRSITYSSLLFTKQ